MRSSPFLKTFVSKAMVFVLPAVFLTLLVVIWQNAAVRQATPIIPGPRTVLLGIAELVRKGLLIRYVVASLFRVSWGFFSAVLVAIPLGLYLGSHRRADRALNPIIQILRPISPLAWIPISILWFGVGDLAATFLIFIASLMPLTVSTTNAVRSIDPTLLNAGRNFGLSGYQMLYLVIYPAVVPQLIVGLRIAVGISWLVVVAAEMIAVNSGLGFLIIDARNSGNRYDLVVVAMLLIGVIGLILDLAIRRLETIPSVRWGFRRTEWQ